MPRLSIGIVAIPLVYITLQSQIIPANSASKDDKPTNCTWVPNVDPNNNDTLTGRHRQCYHCTGTVEHKDNCWSDPPSPQFVPCGFMGDEVCTCRQEWTNIDRDSSKNPIAVDRACMNYKEIKGQYNLDFKQVKEMGCKKVMKTQDDGGVNETKLVEVCFCEADKCNHDEKYSDKAVYGQRAWIWRQLAFITISINYALQ